MRNETRKLRSRAAAVMVMSLSTTGCGSTRAWQCNPAALLGPRSSPSTPFEGGVRRSAVIDRAEMR